MRRSLLLGVMAIVACSMGAADAGSGPIVYAHRGGARLAPENTLGAFRNAEALYAQHPGVEGWLEMDTQLDGDGTLVVIHDDSLDRTTTCTGKVIATSDAALAACDASKSFNGWGAFEPVPHLADVLAEATANGWRLMVELKDIPGEANFDPAGAAAATPLVALVHASGLSLDHLIVESFWPPALEAVKRLDPAMRTMLLTTSEFGFTLTENASFAAARGYEISSPDDATLDLRAESVAYAHALGRKVIVWTVDTAAGISALKAAGVDGIITNDPRLML